MLVVGILKTLNVGKCGNLKFNTGRSKPAANEAFEAMAKHDLIAWLTDKWQGQGNSELLGGDL